MARFVMMVGVPGSGKSTIVKSLSKKRYIVSCPDTFRGMFSPSHDEADQSVNAQAWDAAKSLIVESLRSGKNVVLDATEVYPKGRAAILNILPDCEKEAVYVKVDIETALSRNTLRERKVPEEVIRRMFSGLVEPSVEEGFDKVTVIIND